MAEMQVEVESGTVTPRDPAKTWLVLDIAQLARNCEHRCHAKNTSPLPWPWKAFRVPDLRLSRSFVN